MSGLQCLRDYLFFHLLTAVVPYSFDNIFIRASSVDFCPQFLEIACWYFG